MNYKTIKDIVFETDERKAFWRWEDENIFRHNSRDLLKELRQEAIKMIKFAEYDEGQEALLMRFFEIFDNPKEKLTPKITN